MRHRKKGLRLGVKTDHRLAMMRNLTLGLLEHGRIKTTVARAKRLRPFIEKLVTRLKNPSVANLRIANQKLSNREATLRIARDISPKFKDRSGGYTRILRLAKPRAGDAADMALIEWVDESLVPAYSGMISAPNPKKKSAKKAERKSSSPKAEKNEKKAKEASGAASNEAEAAKPKAEKKSAKKATSRDA
jgi:large subunit ribosomal protein L17